MGKEYTRAGDGEKREVIQTTLEGAHTVMCLPGESQRKLAETLRRNGANAQESASFPGVNVTWGDISTYTDE